MTTADNYDIFPDKTFYSAPINWPQLIEPQLIDPLGIQLVLGGGGLIELSRLNLAGSFILLNFCLKIDVPSPISIFKEKSM